MDGMQDAVQALQIYASNPETAKQVGAFSKEFFGGVGHNIVGILGGDWLYYARLENIAKHADGVRKRLKAAGVQEPAHVSMALGLPLLKAAADESREELAELWERLLTAAMNPHRTRSVRRNFIQAVSEMEPIDALIFQSLGGHALSELHLINSFGTQHGYREDECRMAFANLLKLNVVQHIGLNIGLGYELTGFGRELYRAIQD